MPSENQAEGLSDTQDIIRASARLLEPDRAVAASLAPRAVRRDLMTLAAYLGDVRRISRTVSDATLGEIRLQWWRDTLIAGAQGGRSGNPVADDMVRVIARHNLPPGLVMKPLEAASAELYGEPFEDEAAWLGMLDNAEGAAFQMSLLCLDPDDQKSLLPMFEPAARAYATVRLAQRLPELLSLARWPVPRAVSGLGDPRLCGEAEARAIVASAGSELCGEALRHLDRAVKAHVPLARAVRTALLPASLAPAYVKAISAASRDVLRQPAQIAPMTRVFRLWRASWSGRI